MAAAKRPAIQVVAETLTSGYKGLWVAKLEEWSDAVGARVTFERNEGHWTVRAHVSAKRVFSYTHTQLPQAAAQVWAQISTLR